MGTAWSLVDAGLADDDAKMAFIYAVENSWGPCSIYPSLLSPSLRPIATVVLAARKRAGEKDPGGLALVLATALPYSVGVVAQHGANSCPFFCSFSSFASARLFLLVCEALVYVHLEKTRTAWRAAIASRRYPNIIPSNQPASPPVRTSALLTSEDQDSPKRVCEISTGGNISSV